MTSLIRYLTHPQVNVDPAIPVPSRGLSEVGRARTEAVASAGPLSGTTQIVSSRERKARRSRQRCELSGHQGGSRAPLERAALYEAFDFLARLLIGNPVD
jgi:hypothetical protein